MDRGNGEMEKLFIKGKGKVKGKANDAAWAHVDIEHERLYSICIKAPGVMAHKNHVGSAILT